VLVHKGVVGPSTFGVKLTAGEERVERVREVAQSKNLRQPESWLFEGPGEDLYFSLGNGDRPILATWMDMIKLEDLEGIT
jgi:hypothetical protein